MGKRPTGFLPATNLEISKATKSNSRLIQNSIYVRSEHTEHSQPMANKKKTSKFIASLFAGRAVVCPYTHCVDRWNNIISILNFNQINVRFYSVAAVFSPFLFFFFFYILCSVLNLEQRKKENDTKLDKYAGKMDAIWMQFQ